MAKTKIEMETYFTLVGANIRTLREVRFTDQTKKEICASIGIHRNSLAKIENGEDVKLSTLFKICQILNCRVEDILPRDED